MSKPKLTLEQLQVESFVTSLGTHYDGTLRGGIELNQHVTTILVADTPIYASTGVSIAQLTASRWTFMEADTGGCQYTDLGCQDTKKTQPL